MKIVTKEFKIYSWENAPLEVREAIRDHFHSTSSLGEFIVSERILTLKKIADLLDATLDYSLSLLSDRGEFIKFVPNQDTLNFKELWTVIDQNKECPLTGCCYDHDFIDHLSKYNLTSDGLNFASNLFIESIHEEYLYLLTDESLKDYCEANDYEFYENGEIY